MELKSARSPDRRRSRPLRSALWPGSSRSRRHWPCPLPS